MKLEISRECFKIYINITYHENPSGGGGGGGETSCSTRTDGRTDRHDEDNSRFSKFCECAYKIQIYTDYMILPSKTIPEYS
jgi:hypothetical protein